MNVDFFIYAAETFAVETIGAGALAGTFSATTGTIERNGSSEAGASARDH